MMSLRKEQCTFLVNANGLLSKLIKCAKLGIYSMYLSLEEVGLRQPEIFCLIEMKSTVIN